MRTSALSVIALALTMTGCWSTTTETGYEPRRLGMSEGQRKALYAPKYSPEAAQAQAESDQAAARARKPGGGFFQ
jgi:hypothetical protein